MNVVLNSFDSVYKYFSIHWKNVCKIVGYSSLLLVSRVMCYKLYWKYKKYPPGYVGLPFFGIFFSLRPSNLKQVNIDIANKYGPVAMAYIGPQTPTILINDFNLYCKHFKHSDFNYRPHSWTKNRYNLPADFSMINGKNWENRRKLFYNSLLKITNSKYMTKHVQNNIKNKILIPSIEDAINKKNGKWYLRKPLKNLTFNTLFGASFGPNFIISVNDTNYKRFQTLWKINDDNFLIFLIMTYFGESAMDLFSKIIGTKRFILETRSIVNKWIQQYLEKNKINGDSGDSKESQQDSFVDIILNTSNIDRKTAIADITTIFGAGNNTTRQSIELMLFAVAKYQDIQNKIYMELRDIFNNSDDINIENMLQLNQAHYLRALIEECWRTRNIAGLPRILQKDYKLEFIDSNGNNDYYILPKGAFVGFNNICNARNDKYWKNANKFDIYNYLDDDNKFIKSLPQKYKNKVKYKYSIFGYGGRQCPGLSLARKQVIFTLAILIYKYQFHEINEMRDSGDNKLPNLLNGVAVHELPLIVTRR